MDATEDALRRELADKQTAIAAQSDVVKELKAQGAPKELIDATSEALNSLEIEKASIGCRLHFTMLVNRANENGAAFVDKDAFRHAVVNTLERRLFYIPSFKIYGDVAGLYDYGPPGCAVKSNVPAFWRQHFVLEESMLEVECPCVTPEIVLIASGHVDKCTDLMVKDERARNCYRADHLLKNYCKNKLENGVSISPKEGAELEHDLAVFDDLSAEKLGSKTKDYKITAPDSKNLLSAPCPFNLMFQTSIGPSGSSLGYLRPETAQGIFVNFKDLYYYNGSKLPFAAAQVGQAFRNEILMTNHTQNFLKWQIWSF